MGVPEIKNNRSHPLLVGWRGTTDWVDRDLLDRRRRSHI